MDYKNKFILGDLVKGRRTFNGEIIKGKFNGFHLLDKLDPTSVIGVIYVEGDRCYDVVAGSIELLEGEDEKIRKELIDFCIKCGRGDTIVNKQADFQRWATWLENQYKTQDKGEISDGYHTFNELYYYRMLYNAAFFNMLPKEWVHKSKKHHDGEDCFGGGWFIVMANLPTGQISNHYELKDWDLFQIPEKEVADNWDGHTPQEAAGRLHKYLLENQGEQTSAEVKPKFKVDDWIIRSAEGFKHNTYLVTEVKDYYICEDLKGGRVTFTFNDVHKNFKLWDISDAKDGDVLASNGNIILFKEISNSARKDYKYIKSHCLVLVHSTDFYTEGSYNLDDRFHPATKEQRDLLFQGMKEAGYEWDFEKKELKKSEQKPIWSEEDEIGFDDAVWAIE